jgi:hypothetical protein
MLYSIANDKKGVCLGWLTYLSGAHIRGGRFLRPHLLRIALANISPAKL